MHGHRRERPPPVFAIFRIEEKPKERQQGARQQPRVDPGASMADGQLLSREEGRARRFLVADRGEGETRALGPMRPAEWRQEKVGVREAEKRDPEEREFSSTAHGQLLFFAGRRWLSRDRLVLRKRTFKRASRDLCRRPAVADAEQNLLTIDFDQDDRVPIAERQAFDDV